MSMIYNLVEATDREIEELLADPGKIEAFLEKEVDSIDLDKAWHGIHFLLTGSAWEGREPFCYLLKGGREIGNIDVGYGPARALSSSEVKAFYGVLSKTSTDDLAARFDRSAMMREEIYPTIWDRDREEDDTLGYLLSYYDQLREFLDKCQSGGKGVVTCLT